MFLNFECKKCHIHFDSDVGEVSFNTNPVTLEKDPVCSNCGKITAEEVFLSEIGQSQLTSYFMHG